MAEIKWIKIPVDLFEMDEVKELLNEGTEVFIIWFHLYLKARKIRDNNYVYVVPYYNDVAVHEWVSAIIGRDKEEVKEILNILVEHKFIWIDKKGIKIKDFIRTSKEDRASTQYKEWRTNVFKRDNFTCQKCGYVGGKLNAHHIKSFALYKELRFDLNNGVTLCEICHKQVHKRR